MNPYIIFLIFMFVIVIIIAIIVDKIDKKKKNGRIDEDKITDGERDYVEKKRENMEEYQRIITQVRSFK